MISIKHNELSAGVAFDNYTLSSEHTSDGRFINVYTVLGQLIHDLKYSDSSLDSQKKIINKVISIIDENFRKIDFLRLNNLILVPAPSTKQKDFSTVVELVKKMSEYFDIPFLNSFSKLTCIFAKRLPHGIEFSEDDFTWNGPMPNNTSICIVDDIYGEGKTLTALIRLIRKNANISPIYYLSIVKTRNHGMTQDGML